MKKFTEVVRDLAAGLDQASRYLSARHVVDHAAVGTLHRMSVVMQESSRHIDDLLARASPALLARIDALTGQRSVPQ